MIATADRQQAGPAKPARREQGIIWAVAAFAAITGLLIAGAGFVAVDVLADLHAMNHTLATVSSRMTELDPMSRKLDRLAGMQGQLNTLDTHLQGMSATLRQTNAKLDLTNAQLAATNRRLTTAQGQLRGMDAKLQRMTAEMQGLDRDLTSMRGDIHTMAHKISGSFLFRGVK